MSSRVMASIDEMKQNLNGLTSYILFITFLGFPYSLSLHLFLLYIFLNSLLASFYFHSFNILNNSFFFFNNREGSNLTPAHHYSDFRFKTYAPVAFRYFRDLFGIQPGDFMVSIAINHYFNTVVSNYSVY